METIFPFYLLAEKCCAQSVIGLFCDLSCRNVLNNGDFLVSNPETVETMRVHSLDMKAVENVEIPKQFVKHLAIIHAAEVMHARTKCAVSKMEVLQSPANIYIFFENTYFVSFFT